MFGRERGSKAQHALEPALADDPRSRPGDLPRREERWNVRQSGTDGAVPDRDEIDARARLADHAPARARQRARLSRWRVTPRSRPTT